MRLNSTTSHPTRHTKIDTARRYGNGTSETMLGELKCQERGLLISTKYLPAFHSNSETAIPEGWGGSLLSTPQRTKCQCAHTDFDQRYHPDMLRLTLQKSLAELKTHTLHVYYLGP